jgi:hypothetical protein
MKNLKVTYKANNRSKMISNYLHNLFGSGFTEETDYSATIEFHKVSDDIAVLFETGIKEFFPWVTEVKVEDVK